METNANIEAAHQTIRAFQTEMETAAINKTAGVESRYKSQFFKTCFLAWAGSGCLLLPLMNHAIGGLILIVGGLWLLWLQILVQWADQKTKTRRDAGTRVPNREIYYIAQPKP